MSGLNDAVANRLRDNGRRGSCVGRKTMPPSTDGGREEMGRGMRVSSSPVFLFLSLLFYLQVRWSTPLLSTVYASDMRNGSR